jgi:hypothetical protein
MDPEQLAQQLAHAQQQVQQQAAELAQTQAALQQMQQQMAGMQLQMQNQQAAAQQAAVPQPPQQPVQAPAPKLPKPSMFSGEKPATTLQPWLVQLKTYLAATPHLQMASVVAVNTAAAYLNGSALIWYDTLRTANGGNTPFPGWDEFSTALRQHYLPLNQFDAAFSKLLKLQQTNSVQNYTNRFNELLLSLSDMDQHTQRRMYLEGLKDTVRINVELAGPPTLQAAQELALKADSIQYQSRTQQYNYSKPKHTPGPSTGPTPMELGTHTVDPPAQNYSMRCYNCNQEGHLARDCDKPDRRQDGRGRGRGRFRGGRGRGRYNSQPRGAPN